MFIWVDSGHDLLLDSGRKSMGSDSLSSTTKIRRIAFALGDGRKTSVPRQTQALRLSSRKGPNASKALSFGVPLVRVFRRFRKLFVKL